MPYTDTPPLHSELRAALAQDLRDTQYKTFSDTQMTRFLNDGIVEVNRVYPLQVADDIPVEQDVFLYPTRMTSAFRCELWNDDTMVDSLPYNDGDSIYGGWDLVGLDLMVPPSVCVESTLETYPTLSLKLYGYARRQLIPLDDDGSFQTELDGEAAMAVRWFAQYRAFVTLLSDRSLFKQYQSESNNTDVSMPMLINLLQTARSEWERQVAALRTLRRVPPGSVVVI